MGGETVALLANTGLIKNYADLYTLKIEDVLPLERMAQKSAENLINGIEASKQIPFERVLFGLGIRHVGETVAKTLVKTFKTIENLANAKEEELVEVEEIGGKIAESVVAFFSDEYKKETVQRLKEYGVQLEISAEQLQGQTNKLEGEIIVVSGVFNKLSRTELKKAIEDNGGKVSSSISSKTTYLVAGENMGPSKRTKAEDLNVPIITEDEFLDKIQ